MAQFWGLSRASSAVLLATPFVGGALVALTALLPGLYHALVRVHEVVEVQGSFNALLAVASLYGLAAPWLVRRPSLLAPPLRSAAPSWRRCSTRAAAAFFRHPTYDLAKYSEWPETCFAAALAVFAFLSLRVVRGRGG